MATVLIAGGFLVDGTGAPGRPADLVFDGDRVAAVGPPGSLDGRTRVEAAGLVVAPGFIDPHVHLDAMLLAEPSYRGGLAQGITTVVLGSDGCGYAPTSPATLAHVRSTTAGFAGNSPGIGWDWRTVREYLARFDGPGRVAPNVAYLVPFGVLRAETVGLTGRPATPDEIDRMASLAADGMADGAVGFSFGHPYPPNTYARPEETAAVARAVGSDAVFATHMRAYEGEIDASFEEAFDVGRASGIRVHISHLNMRADEGIGPIDRARAAGLRATFDLYPYLAGSTVLTRQLPEWVLEGGVETTLAALRDESVRTQLRPWVDAPDRHWEFDHPRLDRARTGSPIPGPISVGGGSGDRPGPHRLRLRSPGPLRPRGRDDRLPHAPPGGVRSPGVVRARCRDRRERRNLRGRQPASARIRIVRRRILGRFVREDQSLSLEAAIERMTGRTARIFGLGDRGVLAPGATADIVLFDPARIVDQSTYDDGTALAEGVEAVFVGGRAAVLHGAPTGDLPGRVGARTDDAEPLSTADSRAAVAGYGAGPHAMIQFVDEVREDRC